MNTTQLREAASAVNARTHLSQILSPRLDQWDTPYKRHPEVVTPSYHAHATAIVALYDQALARLKGADARAASARDQISTAREPLAAALALVDSLRADFSGPLGVELQNRITATRANLAAAVAAKELATRSTIDAALLEVERCLADVREIERDLAAIYERLSPRTLQWPDLDALRTAEPATRELERQSAKNPKAAQVHAAIEQGLEAPADVAALFVAFETQPDHELLKWRWRAYAERV